MGYIVIFKRLAGIPNVALLVRPMVQITLIIVDTLFNKFLNKLHIEQIKELP